MALNVRALLLDAAEAAQYLGVSERKFHDMRGTEGFPAAVSLGARSVRWRTADLEAYVQSLPNGPRAEPKHLADPEVRSRRNATNAARHAQRARMQSDSSVAA